MCQVAGRVTSNRETVSYVDLRVRPADPARGSTLQEQQLVIHELPRRDMWPGCSGYGRMRPYTLYRLNN